MDKDKNQAPPSLYPDATRGPLLERSESPAPLDISKKPHRFKHKYDPDSIRSLYRLIFACITIGILGIGIFTYTSYRAAKAAPKIVALTLAQKFTEDPAYKANVSYEALRSQINDSFASCKSEPVISITFHYQPGKHGGTSTDTITVNTGEVDDVSHIMFNLVDKANEAYSSSFAIDCPS